METIQYSLKKNSTYSIDLKSAICTKDNVYTHKTNKIQLHKNKTVTKPNNIFDKHCIETYGEKTCILFELDDDNIEIRLLDNLYQLKYTRRNKLYIIIPTLLEKLYTVVLVQIIQKTNTKEIVAIHFPSK
jgi:hypothetical protein